MFRVTSSSVQVLWTTGPRRGIRQRAWTFDFDGHVFYALDLGEKGTLIYDLITGQWSKFNSAGYGGHWNFKDGFHWRTGKKVVGGADGEGKVLELLPDTYIEEGWRPVVYEVRGLLQTSGVGVVRQYSLRLVGSTGALGDDVAPVLRMQYSDDRGQTWAAEQSIALSTDSRQRLEFRSLGAFAAPGRIFRLYDEGGVKFIAYAEAEVGGQDAAHPA